MLSGSRLRIFPHLVRSPLDIKLARYHRVRLDLPGDGSAVGGGEFNLGKEIDSQETRIRRFTCGPSSLVKFGSFR